MVIVEDIVDTGHTMRYTIQKLRDLKAADVRIATLFFKPNNFQYTYPIDYKGMDIGNEFIVGYGLDYDQQGRNLPECGMRNKGRSPASYRDIPNSAFRIPN